MAKKALVPEDRALIYRSFAYIYANSPSLDKAMLGKVFVQLAAAALALAGDAPKVADSTGQYTLEANFEPTATSKITGFIVFRAATNGTVLVGIQVGNLTQSQEPFSYHIHELPVPANGDCQATLGHFNPYNGSTTATTPWGLEVGDLSGRNGKISGTYISNQYIDEYISLNPDSKSFIGGKSVVIHAANGTRLTCANITIDPHSVRSNGTVTVTPANPNGASQVESGGVLAVGAAAVLALLA
ncbi:uncharacterized protein LODBEIA_P45590 [Lodderomyces beijingensis]|uniref:Superoxide dismutase copper/zinc binding domain-containing protein n=1 Tax=Lodderomyces beijingensis TaxID=1775926 RepID=A0ABP0ZVG8_9ASCO